MALIIYSNYLKPNIFDSNLNRSRQNFPCFGKTILKIAIYAENLNLNIISVTQVT